MVATKIVKTIHVRVKDKHASVLRQMAREVNTVFNFCNETALKALRDRSKWLSGYDLQKLAAGYCTLDDVSIRSGTVEEVCVQHARQRIKCKKARLNWRVSNKKSPKYSLGWVPFKASSVRYKGGQIKFCGVMFSLWDSYDLSKYDLRAGCFSEDSRGRWYFNVAVEAPPSKSSGKAAVGIDLGLKTAITTSTGEIFEGRLYRAFEAKLAKAQRANKKRQVRTIHAKIRNQRKDGLHKFSTALVRQNAAIFVGDVSSSKLVKTKMAKSTHDAGWAMFKTMLSYKCDHAGVVFAVVDENYTTQTCNVCGVIAGPKGRAGLNKRMWQCDCGAIHDRDVNAAINIRARGLASLEAGAGA
jgi:putative transposase